MNGDGLVTRWRDYFDLHQIDEQVAATAPPARVDPGPGAAQTSVSDGTPKYSW